MSEKRDALDDEKRPQVSRREFTWCAAGFAGMLAVGGVGVAFGGTKELLRPPGGQDEDAFRAACLKCDKCRSICPQDCLTIAVMEDGLLNYRTPYMDYRKGYCTFCDECITVCPTDALGTGFDPETERIGLAVIDEDECLAFIDSGACRRCADVCEFEAITINELNHPVVDESLCNGCGECEYECPSDVYLSYSASGRRGINVEYAEGERP